MIIVVGGGVFGVTAAIRFAERGETVVVVDRLGFPAVDSASADISKALRADYGGVPSSSVTSCYCAFQLYFLECVLCANGSACAEEWKILMHGGSGESFHPPQHVILVIGSAA